MLGQAAAADETLQWLAANLPHATASLNALATVLLIAALVAIRQGRERTHRNLMLVCLAVSAVFLLLYLGHKGVLYALTGSPNKPFPRDPAVASDVARNVYFAILLSHLLLAITVPFWAIAAAVTGLRDRRAAHRRIVRWGYPIWLYVSITGVVVYAMLYHVYAG